MGINWLPGWIASDPVVSVGGLGYETKGVRCVTLNLTDEGRRRRIAAPDGKLVREVLKEGIQHNKHTKAIVRVFQQLVDWAFVWFYIVFQAFWNVNTYYVLKFSGFNSCEALMFQDDTHTRTYLQSMTLSQPLSC